MSKGIDLGNNFKNFLWEKKKKTSNFLTIFIFLIKVESKSSGLLIVFLRVLLIGPLTK